MKAAPHTEDREAGDYRNHSTNNPPSGPAAIGVVTVIVGVRISRNGTKGSEKEKDSHHTGLLKIEGAGLPAAQWSQSERTSRFISDLLQKIEFYLLSIIKLVF
jgi:hypothetical protein